jgi:hypothetical protein
MARLPDPLPSRPSRPISCRVCSEKYDNAQFDECPHCALGRGYMLMPNAMQDVMAAQHGEIQRQGRGCIFIALLVVAAIVGLLVWIF